MSDPRVDLEKILVPLVRTTGKKIDLAGSVTSGGIERTIEGASTITLTFRDPDRIITRSGLFATQGEGRKAGRFVEKDIKLDGLPYRLVKVAKHGEEFETVWEDRAVALLREANQPRRARRGDVSRAEFIRSLVTSVRPGIPFNIRGELLPLAELPRQDRRSQTESALNPGFDQDARITIKGRRADGAQLRILEIAMATADDLNAPDQARKALLLALIQESSARDLNYSQDGLSEGALQLTYATARSLGISQHDTPAQIEEFLRNGFWRYRPRGAIELSRSTSMSAGAIAQACQGSAGSGSDYAAHSSEAETIIAAWGGGNTRSERGGSVTFERAYYYSVGKPQGPRGENYWDAALRMAEEVGYRRFVARGEFWWISEEDLFRFPPQLTIREKDDGVDSLDFDVDDGKRIDTATVECHIDRFGGSPAGLVALKDMGPADGKWLIANISEDFFSNAATVTLKKPIREKPEPRGELVTRDVAARGSDTSSPGSGKLFAECKTISDAGGSYVYGGGHGPLLSSLRSGQGLDCSSSVSLALWRAGLFDSNVAWVSGTFASSYGVRGLGEDFTVQAHSGHVYIQFHGENRGWRFDTSPQSGDSNQESGPRMRKGARSSAGFVARHKAGH